MQGIAYDPTNQQLLMVDQGTLQLYAFGASEGFGRVLADLRPLSPAPAVPTVAGVLVDSANNRALVVDWGSDRLGAVNLANGVVSVVSASPGTNQHTSLGSDSRLALDAANNRLFASSSADNTVFVINLTTGVRNVVSGNGIGSGPALNFPGGIAFDNVSDPGSPRLLITDGGFPSTGILSIDVATGNRTLFSGAAPNGTGPTLLSPHDLAIDAPRNRVIASDFASNALFAVDLTTGNRTAISGGNIGTGEAVIIQGGLAVDSASGHLYIGQQLHSVLRLDFGTLARSYFAGVRLGTGPRAFDARAVTLENPDSLLYLDTIRQALMRVDLRNGNRSVASSHETPVGNGPALEEAVDLALDTRSPSNGTRAVVMTGGPDAKLLSVDLPTGNRTSIVQLNHTIPVMNRPTSLVIDADGNRAILLDDDPFNSNQDALYAVDLTTGVRTTISNTTGTGGGAGFGVPVDLVLEPPSNPTRALVSQMAQNGLANGPNFLAIDLSTGIRTEFAPGTGNIPMPTAMPAWLHLHWTDQQILGINLQPASLFSIELTGTLRLLRSGTDGIIGGGTRGTGMLGFGSGLDFDATRAVAYTFADDLSLMAIDLRTGDRVLVSH